MELLRIILQFYRPRFSRFGVIRLVDDVIDMTSEAKVDHIDNAILKKDDRESLPLIVYPDTRILVLGTLPGESRGF